MDLLKPSGNKLALKLFESRKGLIKERSRQQRARNCVCRNDFIEEIILEPRLIAINYIKTWFILDLVSSFPVDYFFLLFDTRENIEGYQ
ncbi:unnamed protein product [Rotaria sp. Silwood2]|nr:unnamed protein product [Rotaria sp. Silwood2]